MEFRTTLTSAVKWLLSLPFSCAHYLTEGEKELPVSRPPLSICCCGPGVCSTAQSLPLCLPVQVVSFGPLRCCQRRQSSPAGYQYMVTSCKNLALFSLIVPVYVYGSSGFDSPLKGLHICIVYLKIFVICFALRAVVCLAPAISSPAFVSHVAVTNAAGLWFIAGWQVELPPPCRPVASSCFILLFDRWHRDITVVWHIFSSDSFPSDVPDDPRSSLVLTASLQCMHLHTHHIHLCAQSPASIREQPGQQQRFLRWSTFPSQLRFGSPRLPLLVRWAVLPACCQSSWIRSLQPLNVIITQFNINPYSSSSTRGSTAYSHSLPVCFQPVLLVSHDSPLYRWFYKFFSIHCHSADAEAACLLVESSGTGVPVYVSLVIV